MRPRVIGIVLLILLSGTVRAQQKPFIFPAAGDPGPNTWLFGQPYGNTVGAYNYGTAWYSAGQGLHFGIDIGMACGTPLVAVADGVVTAADDLSFGSGPHNLLIRHPDVGLISLYGHLLDRPPVQVGQSVTQGDIIGYSGDPDVTCDSRPHLHYEVRSLDYRTTYNPVDYIDINWHNLAVLGSYSYPLFQGDMDNARRWMTLEDQPEVRFGGARLNAYTSVYPPPQLERPSPNALLPRTLPPLGTAESWQLRRIGLENCCWITWWDALDPDRLYTIDGAQNSRAVVFAWSASAGSMETMVSAAPPPHTSPDGRYQILREAGQISLSGDGQTFVLQTEGATPSISPDNAQLMWVVSRQVAVPGARRPDSSVWVSTLDGSNARQIVAMPGVSAQWLDASRLLLLVPGAGRLTTVTVYDTADDTQFTLGEWTWIRNLTISPGGTRLMLVLTNQSDPAASGIYTLETQPGASPQRLDWFGGWRWRDADSVYYIPLEPYADTQTLHHYHIPSREDRMLTDPQTTPFTVMNGDWSVSADGRRIAFHNAVDRSLWLLEIP